MFSYEWNDTVFYESGIYSYNTINENGCEVTMHLDLTILNDTDSVIDIQQTVIPILG